MPLVVLELSLVLTRTVKPFKFAKAILTIVDPVALVLDSIGPRVNTIPIDVVIFELAAVDTAVGTIEHALPMFLSGNEFAHVRRIVRERFRASTMWMLVDPVTLIEGAVWVPTKAASVQHIVGPLPLVHRAVTVDVSAVTMALACNPVAKVV